MRIGLILNVLDEDYQIAIFKGVKEEAARRGVELFCIQQENPEYLKAPLLSDVLKKDLFKLDGIVYLTSVMTDIYDLKDVIDVKDFFNGIPVVSVGQKIDGVPSLVTQTDFSMKQLVEHLILKHGYRKFIFLGGPQNHPDAIAREEIFKKTVEAYRPWYGDLDYKILNGLFTEESAIELMTNYTASDPELIPDAIVCSNDNMAIGVYKFFKMNTKNTVHECAVTGFDDISQVQYSVPSITTVHQPVEEMGRQAVTELLNMIAGKKQEELTFIESNVVYRESCGCILPESKSGSRLDIMELMQADFIKSEQNLRMISHFGQYASNARAFDVLRYYIKTTIEPLAVSDFSIVLFDENSINSDTAMKIRPYYVFHRGGENHIFKNGVNESFYDYEEFFMDFVSPGGPEKTFVLKYLISGNECIGFALYNCDVSLDRYLCTMINTIAHSLSRIIDENEKKKRSEYLEQEVEKRTHELIEANTRRIAVEAEVLKISEMERQRFSNDLHDDICQRLAGISMLCRCYSNQDKPVEKAEMVELAELITDTLQATRQYAHNSFPVEIENLGLKNSISNLCNSFEKQSGIKCEYEWLLSDDALFDSTQKLNIFRIIQEALHNSLKHANAGKTKVSLYKDEQSIIVEISDDGCGIKKDILLNGAGLGFNSMQYRANQIDATFDIKPSIPKGTVIQIKLRG